MADQTITKKEFLEMTSMILGGIVHPSLLTSSLKAAAEKLGIPDASSIVSEIVKANAPAAKEEKQKGKGKKDKKEKGDKKEDREKRAATWWSVFTGFFADYCVNYGKNPRITALRDANPSAKTPMTLAGAYLKSLPEDKLKRLKEEFGAVAALLAPVPGADPSTASARFKEYESSHPDKSFSKISGLDRKAEWKTDPAQMKAEAATARKAAREAATPAANGAKTTPSAARSGKGATAAAAEEDEEDEDEKKGGSGSPSKSSSSSESEEEEEEEESEEESSSSSDDDDDDEVPATATKGKGGKALLAAAAAKTEGEAKKRKAEAAAGSSKKAKEDAEAKKEKEQKSDKKEKKDKKKDKK